MNHSLRSFALATVIASAASAASAVSVTPFDTPLSAGDATFGNAVATAFEDFGMTTLSFTAADDLKAEISATINPFLVSPSGTPSNTISLGYSVNAGAISSLSITEVPTPAGSIGAAGTSLALMMGDTVSFFVNGSAGESGNQVTFAVETSVVPVAPAMGFALTGLLALGLVRRRKS